MMKACRLKMCGLSRFGDILTANDVLPDYIGFVFVESGCGATPDKATQLRRKLDKRVRTMGVFVKAPIEEIPELTGHREKERVIDLIQFHGDEGETYIRQLKKHAPLPVIRAVRVRNREQILEAQELSCDYLLLSTYTKGRYGGSGTQFDWNMVPRLKKPYFLAGDIYPDNMRQAVSHGSCCTDANSTVGAGGRRDRRKMGEITQVLR